MYTRCFHRSFISSLNINANDYVSVVQSVTRSNRQDTRRLRFSFFRLQCQTAGNLSAPICDRHYLAPVPFSGMPATWSADRILNFHETVDANRAPQALSEARYRCGYVKVSSTVFELFQHICKYMKKIDY
jgi:hypothetical protein